MVLITGKDFAFQVDNQFLVRLAIRELRESRQVITIQSITAMSGLDRADVIETVRQMLAEQGKK